MKCIGIIPARYKSSRFEGKPLATICDKPMIYWVYKKASECKELEDIYVATDDERIYEYCLNNNMNAIMTSDMHKTPTERIKEVSDILKADIYVSVNGDEPLIEPNTISAIIPKKINLNEPYVANLMTTIIDPVEVIDFTNLKIVTNESNKCIYISRSPIPYPKGTMECKYKKHVGVYAFNKKALDFYVSTPRQKNENIEDIDLLRYIETGIEVNMIDVSCNTLSVDTPKDLIKVQEIMKKELKKQAK